ncbi:hypothetical protein ACIOEW_14835 [Streptomyces sp. NPDC087901]|uniref:hypothetical protein n=1 Tax=Streptomyces sp. NPDC087901 TaxID=3365818 RepID=UPI00382A4A57
MTVTSRLPGRSAGSVATVGTVSPSYGIESYGIDGLTRGEGVPSRSSAATDPGPVRVALETLGERTPAVSA